VADHARLCELGFGRELTRSPSPPTQRP